MEKINNKLITPILVLVIAVLLVSIVTFGRAFQEKGMLRAAISQAAAVTNPQPSQLPRHIFYLLPHVYPKEEYATTCYPKGEVMPASPDVKCCEGLAPIAIIDSAQDNCFFVIGAALCADCGNSRCEYGENNCNCPQDCNFPFQKL